MNPQISMGMRLGLMVLGLLTAMAAPAAASPLGPSIRTAASRPSPDVELVGARYRSNCAYDYRCRQPYRYRNNGGNRYYYRRYPRVYPRYYIGPAYPAYRYVAPRRYYGRGPVSAHVAWCYNRYRSYRAWDNTFQPYHGPRRQCWSPYRR